jgi:hypothetical protein
MSTYREIVGKKIRKVTSDPSTGIDGQMWYNSTTGSIRGLAVLEAWSSVAGMIRSPGTGGTGVSGTSTATVAFGGQKDNPYPVITDTEEFNGSGWSSGGATPAARFGWVGGIGTATAALGSGGFTAPGSVATESYEYDGSSWTEGGDISTGRGNGGGAGTQTAGLAFGGRTGGPSSSSRSTAVEEYNGTSWTGGTVMPAATDRFTGAGLQTAAIQAGGDLTNSTSGISSCSEYDGSSWTALPSLNTSGRAVGNSGTTTSALAFGGQNRTTATESFNGTSWTTSPATLANARSTTPFSNSNSAPNNSSALAVGTPPYANACEQYNSSTNVITAGAWSSGNAMNTARAFLFGLGPKTAAIGAGGYISPFAPTANSEEYDGTSWTEGNNLNTARYGISGLGTQTAAVAVGGDARPPGSQYNNNSEHYDGSSWTNATAYPVAIQFTAGAGTQTAGVIFGGAISPGRTAQTSEYDGSSWTTSSPLNMNTARSAMGSGGTQTAAIGFGGSEPAASNKTETYNGSTWTAGGTLINSFPSMGNSGGGGPNTSTTDILAAGGPPHKTNVEGYNGTSWSTRPSLALGRSNFAGGGTSSSGVIFGGDSAPEVYTAATEEFTGETTTGNIKTFSTS